MYVGGRSVGNYLAGRNAAYVKQSWANTIGAAGLSGNRNSRYKGEIPSVVGGLEGGIHKQEERCIETVQ